MQISFILCVLAPVWSLGLKINGALQQNAHKMGWGAPNQTLKEYQEEEMEADASDASIADRIEVFKAFSDKKLLKGVGKNIGDAELREKIGAIKKLSGAGGMTPDEYFHWMSYVRNHAPQKLLVWGLGYDSILIDKLNEGGETRFLEMNAGWVKNSNAKSLNYISYNDHEFRTSVASFSKFLKQPYRANISALNDGTCWDTILVDSPNGYASTMTGRSVPIYTAKVDIESCMARKKYMSNQDVTVFVHDCKRPLEMTVSKAFLGEPQIIGSKTLNQYTLQKSV